MSDKNIPLSELIRIGSRLTGQCRNKLYDQRANTTCAIGAAYLAKHGEVPEPLINSYNALKSCGVDPLQMTKLYGTAIGPLVDEICLINDRLGWTREQIADRLQELGL